MYDFNHPVFGAERKYLRWAKEHMELAALQSSVIRWEVVQTVSPLRIPVVYHIHYHLRSIVGTNPDRSPVFGHHHTLELSITENWPRLEPCRIYMKTPVWHPNIKWDGNFKGRVCGNTDGFGMQFGLYDLVVRVGEILQYKNYHAIHTPPYPEDSKVAAWVTEYAEPNRIVHKNLDIFTDNSPLVRSEEAPPPPMSEPSPSSPVGSGGLRKITIGAKPAADGQMPRKITIGPR